MLIRTLFSAYSRLVLFAIGLLLGIQVPGFIDQYTQRIDAHFREVSINISGFQETADRQFSGDLQALINYYAASNDPVFVSDAESIQLIADRYQLLSAEQAALQASMLASALHVMFRANPEFFDETLTQYSYTVPLNAIAIQWGLALAILLTVTIDLTLFGCVRCVRWLGHRRHAAHTATK